jgi:hypothetical protein
MKGVGFVVAKGFTATTELERGPRRRRQKQIEEEH